MKDKYCVIGLFHKEAFYIPYWQNYYGGLFGHENLYVMGDLTNDPFMKLFHKKVNTMEFGAKYHKDYDYHVATMKNLQTQLLDKYETVIFAEADQFIAPDLEKYRDLPDFLDKNHDEYFTFQGYNVIADLDNEPPLDPTKSLLSQRKWWHLEPTESKMCIVRKPVEFYSRGFHYSTPSVAPHPDLYNIHMHEADFEIQNSRVHLRNDTKLPTHPETASQAKDDYSLIQDDNLLKWHKERFFFEHLPHPKWAYNIGHSHLIPEMFRNSGIV